METFQEAEYPRRGLAAEVDALKKKVRHYEQTEETTKKTKDYKFPFKWNFKFRQARKKNKVEQALVFYFNKKGEIEAPKFMPIYSGNMIIWKNKPYEFDPRSAWRLKTRGYPVTYCLKEIDRRPISNLDLDEIRKRGDSTESDEFLIKAALKAQTTQLKGKMNWIIIGIVVILLIGGLVWLIQSGNIPGITAPPSDTIPTP